MNQDLSPIQKVLLETFKAFDQFCKENHIQYFAAYGTLIGAIRHKGFIPWDDDMDVYMLREEYDKFLSLREKMHTTKYKVADYHDDGYPYDFAKFYDTTKTFWEYPQFPFVIGPFVDVFPLDVYDPNSERISKLYDDQHYAYWKFRKSISYYTWREIGHDIITFNGLEAPIKLVKKIYYRPHKSIYRRTLEKYDQQLRELKGNYYKAYTDVKSKYYPKELFNGGVEVPFEDTTIMVPAGYDKILSTDYGDYMTPPPSPARSGHHTAYYMNLENRLEIDEIIQLKSNELQSKQKMSIKVLFDELIHRKGF